MNFDRGLNSNGNPMEAVVGFGRAVRVGPFISVGGTAPVDAHGNTVGTGDAAARMRPCIEAIKPALEQAGSGLHDVVRTRVILTDIDDWETAIDVRKDYFRDVGPVDTIMAIDRFVNPVWLVEPEAGPACAAFRCPSAPIVPIHIPTRYRQDTDVKPKRVSDCFQIVNH